MRAPELRSYREASGSGTIHRMMKRIGVGMVVALTAMGWLGAESEGAAEAEASLEAAERAFAEAASERDLERFRSFLAEDVIFSTPQGPLRGPQAVVEAWGSFFDPEGPSIGWEPTRVAVTDGGRIGLSTGPYRVVRTTPEGEAAFEGYFSSVWRRRADGQWEIILDSGTPPQPMERKEAPLAGDEPPG